MTAADIMLTAGLLMGFMLGIPAGVWLCEIAKKRDWK